ncbi:MAG: hypothetical protein EXR95_05690 [Gemmatimonadetes bacterium]|nr:hypothetical protein [Gemmatimonadota bacterium]
MRLGWTLLALLWLGAAVDGCCGNDPLLAYLAVPGPPHPAIPQVAMPAEVRRELEGGTWAEFRNVDFRFDEDLVLRIRSLRVIMKVDSDGPVVFDDPDSFVMELAGAETSMGARDITALLGRYVFGYPGAPLKELTVRPEADGQAYHA